MAGTEHIKEALGGGKHKGKTHTHGVHYERAHNGGFLAHVHKHYGEGPHEDGGHSHTEEHVLPDADSAQEHMEEHMGDQPAVGAAPEPAGPPQQEGAEPEGAMAGQMA